MRRIAKLSIVVTIVCLLILFIETSFLTSKGRKLPSQKKTILTIKDICEKLPTDEREGLCSLLSERCTASSDIVDCASSFLVRINKTEAARKVCELAGPATFLQRYCMANALASIDLNASLKECDSMEGVVRYFCRADQKRKVLGIDAGLPECDNIITPDEVHFCRACVYSPLNNELAKKECNSIVDEERRKECFDNYLK